jgi:hypothetical protein
VADPKYARLNTGASITRANSGNGALPTRGSEQAENKRDVGQITEARTRRPPFGNDHLHTPAMWAVWQTHLDRGSHHWSLLCGEQKGQNPPHMKYWEIIADNLSTAELELGLCLIRGCREERGQRTARDQELHGDLTWRGEQ